MKFIGGINKELPVPSDITLSAFEESIKILNGEPPMLLGATRHQLTPEVIAMVTEYSPITAIVMLPEAILNHPNTWFLAGTTIVAVSQWRL